MRKIFLSLLLLAFAVNVNAQLLYRITGKGLEKPSYIIGTYHIAPASFADSIPGAQAALEAVEQVCGEVVMSEMESRESQKRVKAAMTLPDGKSLADVLSESEMEVVNAYMKQTIGMDLTNPLLKKEMGSLTPAALATQLQLLQYIKMTPGFNPMKLIDAYLQKAAVKAKKPVIGFETVDFQINLLYESVTLERGKQQLFCMIENSEYYALQMQELAAAYFSQDMDVIAEIAEEKMGNMCDSTPEEDEALIYARNADWAEKIPAIVAGKATLFVVGAAHLPGERGVLELLRQKGYVVEAVK